MRANTTILKFAFAALMLGVALPQADATPLGATRAIEQPGDLIHVARAGRGGGGPRGGMARGGMAHGGMAHRATAMGPRGGVAHSSTVRRGAAAGGGAVRHAGVARPGGHGAGTRWVRPNRYWWPAGGAIAAGAAIGVVSAATAAAWAGPAPAPNMCWYYTDPSRTQGFWDVCQ